MQKVSIWVTLGAALAAFVAGFTFANYLNKTQLNNPQPVQSQNDPSSNRSATQTDTLSDDEIDQKLKEAASDPENFAFQKGLGLGLYRYGAVRENENIIEKAIPVLERAYRLNPDDFDILVGLGNAHFDVGYHTKNNESFSTARTYYAKALAKRPSDIEVRTDVGLTYFLMSPPDQVSAVTEFEKALAIDPKHEKTLGFLIQSLDALGKDSSKFRETLKGVNPQNPNIQRSGDAPEGAK